MTNATVAAGMITGREPRTGAMEPVPSVQAGERVSRAEREARNGSPAVTLWLDTPADVAHQAERVLFETRRQVYALSAEKYGVALPEIAHALNEAGVIAIIHGSGGEELRERTRERVGAKAFLQFAASGESASHAADSIIRSLSEGGFLAGIPGD